MTVEFLVRIDASLPESLSADERENLVKRERARGIELRRNGTISRIWRLPGTTSNVGIWMVPTADELHAALSTLPIFPWARVTVTALATHPLELLVETKDL